MSDLVHDFVADVRAGYERLRPALACLAANSHDLDARGAVFRFVHTVHGNAGFLNFERFGRLAAAAEEALSQMRDGLVADEAACIVAVMTLVERMGALAEAIDAGIGMPVHDEAAMIAALGIAVPEPRTLPISIDQRPDEKPGSIRLPRAQFEQLATCFDSVAMAHRDLLGLVSKTADVSLSKALANLSTRIASMEEALSLTQLAPVEKLFTALDRIVSQTATALGKQVELVTSGGALMIDRDVVEGLRDPLLHLIRNALDHGFETDEERRKLGKDPIGRLMLDATVKAQHFVLVVQDDGRGVDRAAVVESAAARDVHLVCDPAALGNDQLMALMVTPGVTTARGSSALSGRGIGLDAVQARLNGLGGSMTLADDPGQGARFTLRVPQRHNLALRSDAA
jgi:two-component system, chemotaxis family, sensor kinase CheA